METAKVDVRKLQLLNDRINQTIDALNQVRLSVHGLQHTGGLPGIGQLGPTPMGMNPFYAQQPWGMQQPFGLQPGIAPLQPQPFGVPGLIPGLSHTTGLPGALGTLPFSPPQALYGQPGFFGGIQHSSPEAFEAARWMDPFWASRLASAFPYAFNPIPPVVSLY